MKSFFRKRKKLLHQIIKSENPDPKIRKKQIEQLYESLKKNEKERDSSL